MFNGGKYYLGLPFYVNTMQGLYDQITLCS